MGLDANQDGRTCVRNLREKNIGLMVVKKERSHGELRKGLRWAKALGELEGSLASMLGKARISFRWQKKSRS